jgi:type II secretory pathway component PulF
MDLGLPARFTPGKLRTLRLFGSLTSHDREALRSVFESVSDGLPLVIDMTNFGGMGTVLYPIFVQFAKRKGHLAWACSEHAKHHLKAMGLNESRIFGNVDDAIDSLAQK